MKRMYIILAVIFVVMVGALSAIGQIITQSPPAREPFDRAKRRMELREEMHRRMRAKLFQGQGPDQDMFKDMESAFAEAMDDAQIEVANFKSEWSETQSGRVLTLTPQSPEQKLNIDVNATVITIKGESVQKTDTTSISSSFVNSFPVPDDCDGTKVKMNQKGGSILVELPFKIAKAAVKVPANEERKPLPPSAGDIEI